MNQVNVGTRPKNGFGTWLRQKCSEEGLSIRKLAAKAGLSHVTIVEIKNGSRPSAETIKKLAAAFSNNGANQRVALEDYLLSICGYRSERMDGELSESQARLLDKVSQFSQTQFRLVEEFADYVAKVEQAKPR